MALFEHTPSRSGSRFGKLSLNMFFTRNTAKPKRVRHIEGLNGALICSVNDDPSVVNSAPNSALGFSRTDLPALQTTHRVEKLVPPMGFWNTSGVIQDTERWRQELASLASASGLGIERDEHKHNNKPTTTTADQQNASRSGARYSVRTGRFNEGTGRSRGRTSSKHATALSDALFNVPENEREMWMLQVLCQLLGTSNLEDVQSWLVSASPSEKERARTMINNALRGLKESDRTLNQSQQPVDLDSLSNFVEKQKNEEKQTSQKYIKESLNRPSTVLQSINEELQSNNQLKDSWSNLANNNYPNSSPQNLTTYKGAYQNYNQRSYTSFDTTTTANNQQQDDDNDDNDDEQIETIQLDDNRQRSRSESPIKNKKRLERSSSTFQRKHPVESLQLDEDDDEQEKETILPQIKTKESANQDDDIKSRKIRQLQNRLSRQEEKSKKQMNELQSKQSRLENAIKLLTKQTSSQGKRRQQSHDNTEKDPNAPIVNVVIESQKDNNRRLHDKQQETGKLKKSSNMSKNRMKIGDSNLENVKIQINLSRLDNRLTRSYSGIWKPDASTLHRLQGNQ